MAMFNSFLYVYQRVNIKNNGLHHQDINQITPSIVVLLTSALLDGLNHVFQRAKSQINKIKRAVPETW